MVERYKFILINENIPSVHLDLEYITTPILWCNKGIYGLIPLARIYNALENWKDINTGSTKKPTGVFYWHNTVKVPPQIAATLLCKDKNDKCTYRGKSGTKSE